MFTFLAIVHVVVSIFMILFILLQDPKGGSGGALGMLGGGSSKSLFGHTGGNQFLVNVTKWTAVIFAFTCIYLATLSSQTSKSVMEEYSEQSTPKDTTKQNGTSPNTENNKVNPSPSEE